jgi:hypothetical protein
MNTLTYQETVWQALQQLYTKVVSFLPNLLVAIIVLILGWLIAIFLSKLVLKVLEVVKIDVLADQLGMKNLSEKVGKTLSLSKLGAWLVKWFFFLGSFIAAAEILGLSGVSSFLFTDVLSYAGNVVMAMAILLLGLLAANFFSGLVNHTVKASGWQYGGSLGAITKWAILIFTIIAVLSQLRIANEFIQDLFRAVIAMVAIAGGIAFGLGGKDHANKALDKIEEHLTRHN